MRKIRITIILLCSIISIYANSIVVFASCPISQSTSESASAEAEKYYNMLPSALRKQFESEGWTITITSVTAVNMASAAFGGGSNEYAKSAPAEYFAEAFREYIE